jgi:translation initiation factor 6 (eIF-6)
MPDRRIFKATATAIALAFAAAPMTALTAQSAVAQQQAEYSSAELDIFAGALLQVAEVRQKYTALLQNAETEDQQAAIVEEANSEITRVIEDTDGIGIDRYTEIAEAANQDQGLNQRIVRRIQSMNDESQ